MAAPPPPSLADAILLFSLWSRIMNYAMTYGIQYTRRYLTCLTGSLTLPPVLLSYLEVLGALDLHVLLNNYMSCLIQKGFWYLEVLLLGALDLHVLLYNYMNCRIQTGLWYLEVPTWCT